MKLERHSSAGKRLSVGNRALAESEARLSGIVISAMDGIITINEKREIVLFNPAAEKMFGYRAEELRGRSVNLLIPESFREAHDRHIVRFGKTGTTSRVMGRLGQIVGLRANGDEFPIEASISQIGTSPTKLFTVILRDITERQHAERSLRESEEKLRLFIQYAPSAIAMFDSEMRYIAFSRRWLIDYDLGDQDLVGRSHYDVFPELPQRWKDVHRRCLAGSAERCQEDSFERADGDTEWVRWEVHPWHESAGHIGGIIMFSEVITERKRADEQVRLSYSRLQELSRRLVDVEDEERRNINRELHDRVGQDLAAVKLNIELIRAMLAEDTRRVVDARLDDAQRLVQSAIDHARNVMADLHPPGLDDFGLLTGLRMHADAVAKRLGISVKVSGEDSKPRLPPAVETALYRIVREALNNIAKHARAKNAEIVLVVGAHKVTLTVADDGAGFDSGTVPANSYGLRIMRERAEAVGARFDVDSAPGRGTRIMVSLVRTT